MKLILSISMRGSESACTENLDYIFTALDPLIVDEFNLDIKTFTEEEFEK